MREWDEKQKTSKDVQAAVTGGDYQVGIVIPVDSSVKFQEETVRLFQQNGSQGRIYIPVQIPVQVFFDPGVMPGFRSGLTARLQIALKTIGMEAKIGNLGRVLNSLLEHYGISQDVAGLPVADNRMGDVSPCSRSKPQAIGLFTVTLTSEARSILK